jgi:hypothetical protein
VVRQHHYSKLAAEDQDEDVDEKDEDDRSGDEAKPRDRGGSKPGDADFITEAKHRRPVPL